MVKHTQTIGRLVPKNCLGVFDHFVGLALKAFRVLISELLLFTELMQHVVLAVI